LFALQMIQMPGFRIHFTCDDSAGGDDSGPAALETRLPMFLALPRTFAEKQGLHPPEIP
jgi:hypothetical protein